MTTETDLKLLPCPCCGKQNLDHNDYLHPDGVMRIRCVWCHCEAPESAWNRRAASAEPPQAIFALGHIAAFAGTRTLKTIRQIREYAKHNADSYRASVAQEPVAIVDGDEDGGMRADLVPNHGLVPGQELYAVPVTAQAHPVVNKLMTTESKNIRTGYPYDDPSFERLCREHGIWGTPQSALCAVFWRAGRASAQDRRGDHA